MRIKSQYGSFLSLFLLTFSSFALGERFHLASETYKTREEGEVTRHSLVTDTTRYFFRPPYGWRLSADVEQRTVIFLAPDQSVAVKMQIGSKVSCEDLAELRKVIKTRYVNGEIRAESTIYTADGIAAPSFDIEWSNAQEIPITTRLVFVPTENGTIEFSLATGRDRFDISCKAINNLASSFRTEAMGAYAKK